MTESTAAEFQNSLEALATRDGERPAALPVSQIPSTPGERRQPQLATTIRATPVV